MFGCSEERDMAGGVMKGPKLEPLPDWDSLPPIEEGMAAADAATEMADDEMKGPKLEPLPDWDSLPPIEEGMAAEEGSTMMEKAEEKVEDDS